MPKIIANKRLPANNPDNDTRPDALELIEYLSQQYSKMSDTLDLILVEIQKIKEANDKTNRNPSPTKSKTQFNR